MVETIVPAVDAAVIEVPSYPPAAVARNYIFSLIWRCYGPKRDILDYWGTNIFCILSYYILSKDKGL